MNRDLRIFLLAIGLPALLLALGGLRLIKVEVANRGEADRAVLKSVAKRTAADLQSLLQSEIDELLAPIVTETNNVTKMMDEVAAASNYVAKAWFDDQPREFRGQVPHGPEAAFGRPEFSGDRQLDITRRRSGSRLNPRSAYPGGHAMHLEPIPESGIRHSPHRQRPMREKPPIIFHRKAAFERTICFELDEAYAYSRIRELLRKNGVDDPENRDAFATIAEIRSARDDQVLMASSTPPCSEMHGEANFGLAPQFDDWKLRVYRRLGDGAFASSRQHFLLLGGVMLVLLFCSLVGGAVVLLRAARAARREALQKTDFISNVSHEFKTPLTTICLCAELASGDDLDADERKRALASVQSETERLRRMVMNVLDFSRLEKNRRVYESTTFDVAELVRTVAVELAPRFAEHGLQVAAGSYCVQADRDAANQILLNLIENAAKYAADGGPVEVAFAKVGEYVEVRVADRGPGLTPEQMRHVFERFWRADNSTTRETGGNGLGLAISQGLAQGMNGKLVVAVRTGGGCVFTLSLRADGEAEGGNHV